VLTTLVTWLLSLMFLEALRLRVAEPDAGRVPPAGTGPDPADLVAALAAGRAERRAVNYDEDDDDAVRCPACGCPARSRSPQGWPTCAPCGRRLSRRWAAWVVPAVVAIALAALVLFTWLGAGR
jgi:hypothetical protein